MVVFHRWVTTSVAPVVSDWSVAYIGCETGKVHFEPIVGWLTQVGENWDTEKQKVVPLHSWDETVRIVAGVMMEGEFEIFEADNEHAEWTHNGEMHTPWKVIAPGQTVTDQEVAKAYAKMKEKWEL